MSLTSGVYKIKGDWSSGNLSFSETVADNGAEFQQNFRTNMQSINVNAANTDGGVFKCGTSAAPVTQDTANMKFFSIYVDNGATSGDNRAVYLRQYLTGAGGGGEAARIFTTCNNVACGTAHGAHISLSYGATGSVTGLGVAMRGTMHVPNANLAGTTAAVMAELWADGASSNNTGTMSHIRVSTGGNATGITALKDVYFIEFAGMAAGAGDYINTSITTHTAYGGLKVKIPGVGDKYIALVTD